MPNETPSERRELPPPSPDVQEELDIIADFDACAIGYLQRCVPKLTASIQEENDIACYAGLDGDMDVCDQHTANMQALTRRLEELRAYLRNEEAKKLRSAMHIVPRSDEG